MWREYSLGIDYIKSCYETLWVRMKPFRINLKLDPLLVSILIIIVFLNYPIFMGGSGIQTPMQIFSVAQHIMPKITSYTNYSFDHAKVDLIRTVSCDVKKKNKH